MKENQIREAKKNPGNSQNNKEYQEKKKENQKSENIIAKNRKTAMEQLSLSPNMEHLWQAIRLFEEYPFVTAKGLKFTYRIRGNEIFFSRKEKSVTKSTVQIAYQRARELGGVVAGPKKLGVFGASYLYPVFHQLGIIKKPS